MHLKSGKGVNGGHKTVCTSDLSDLIHRDPANQPNKLNRKQNSKGCTILAHCPVLIRERSDFDLQRAVTGRTQAVTLTCVKP